MTDKVKVTLNPVEQAAKPVNNEATITDERGRVLSMREPDVLAPYRLVQIIGADAAENRVYMNMVFPLLYLKSIDGEAVIQPNSRRELEALIQQLDHAGVKALRAGVEKNFGSDSNGDDEVAAVKK